jgi:hypothetical protein
MKHIHVVVPDLFLPPLLAKDVCAGLSLPGLEKLLARGKVQALPQPSLEAWLCDAFAVPESAVAPVTLLADGLLPESAYWLRADPVHLHLDRNQIILQTNVAPSLEEAVQLCAHLNQHFVGGGMQFFAPHPRRWYLRLDESPGLTTHSVYAAEGRNTRFYLPQETSGMKWHAAMNEVQMLLHGHPANEASEARGSLPINSVWLWGGGRAVMPGKPFELLYGDSELAALFARAAGIPYELSLSDKVQTGNALYVLEGLSAAVRRGDFHTWRTTLSGFERECLNPLLRMLVAGKIERITLDAVQEDGSRRYELTRPLLWRLWKKAQPLASYTLV